MEEAHAATSEKLAGEIVQPVIEVGEHIVRAMSMSVSFLGRLVSPDFEDVHVGSRRRRVDEVAL